MVKNVADTIFALHGHISGDYVVCGVLNGDFKRVCEVTCSIPKNLVHYLPRVLAIQWTVESLSQNHFAISSNMFPTVKIELSVTPYSSGDAPNSQSAFDLDMLTMSSSAIYTSLAKTHRMPRMPLGVLITRCREKRFSHMDTYGDPNVQALAMARAAKLLSNGYTMDDFAYGRVSWVVSEWGNINLSRRPLANKPLTIHPVNELSSIQQCAICCDYFKHDDLVVNLACNHNFHVGPFKCGGITSWLARGDGRCPCCRKSIKVTP